MEGIVNIRTYDDGIYLVVKRSNVDDFIEIEDIQELIKREHVRNVDFNAIFSAISNPELEFEVKISDNLQIIDFLEFVDVRISQDKLKAYLKFQEKFFNSYKPTKADLYTLLEGFDVIHGIVDETLEDILVTQIANHEYVVAKGTKPTLGKDGYIKLYIDTEAKTLKPKMLEDGSVDYLNIDFFQQAKKGEILARKIPLEPGTAGKNVLGDEVPAKTVKKAPPFPQGKNIRVIPDENILIATVNGQIMYKNKRIDINPLLEVQEVSPSTGNINFDGSVVVYGNVVYGTKINAGGSVKVHGIVEAATIISGSDVILVKGAMGSKKALIVAEGDVKANFIDSCTVKSGKSVYSNSIMHSKIVSNDKLILTGKKGLLVGGKIYVKNEISAKNIGSPLGTFTIIEVGNAKETVEKYKGALREKVALEEKLVKLDHIINSLKAIEETLSTERRQFMVKTVTTKIHVNYGIGMKNKEIADLEKELQKQNGKLIVQEILHPGVKITVGNATISVDDPLNHVCLINREDAVAVMPI